MIGRLLCFVGLHRWSFQTEVLRTHGHLTVATFARCSRGCPRYDVEALVDLDRHRLPILK